MSRLYAILTLAGIFLFTYPACKAQDTEVYYYTASGRTTEMQNARRKVVVEWETEKRAMVQEFTGSEDESWQPYSRERIRIKSEDRQIVICYRDNNINLTTIRTFNYKGDGVFSFQDFRDGQIVRYGETRGKIPLHLEGEMLEFYPDGNKRSESHYKDNLLLWNINWLESGERYIDSIFYLVDRWPVYIPGASSLKGYIKARITSSPEFHREISGRVTIGFVVMEDGTLDGIRIMEGGNMNIAEDITEAFRQLPGEWAPGVLDMKPVRCFMVFPVNFMKETGRFEYIDMEGGILFYNYR